MAIDDFQDKKAIRDRLNRVSPSFCAAKWLQVTMHLHSGHNHSCHHPGAHKTPLKELRNNPSALHNTEFKKAQRAKMKFGMRPSECQYCWNIEDLGPHHLSDRTLKSADHWARNDIEKIADLDISANINPTYVEVSFSNVCNFKCSYCSANFSSRWADELKRFGNYSTGSGVQTMKILPEEENPYIKAFWEWWPDLVKDLRVFRITGGEPLLSPNTFRVLEDLKQNPRPNLEVAINSNLGVADASIDKFIALAQDLVSNKKIKGLQIYTSVDAFGAKAEYIRSGLQFPRFQKNLERILSEVPGAHTTIMVTFNALSLTSFRELLQYVLVQKKKYAEGKGCPLSVDISYLRNPPYQTVQILPEIYLTFMNEIRHFMEDNAAHDENPGGFYFYEAVKMRRIAEWMEQPVSATEQKKNRKDFYKFFSEHDKRRGTSFLETFPEMSEFWQECQALT